MFRDVFPRRLVQWLGPLLAAGLLAIAIATLVVLTGVFNLAATTPHPQPGRASFTSPLSDRSRSIRAISGRQPT